MNRKDEVINDILLELSHVQVFFDVVKRKIEAEEEQRRTLIDGMEPAIMQVVKERYALLQFIKDHDLQNAFNDYMADIDIDLHAIVVENEKREQEEEVTNES